MHIDMIPERNLIGSNDPDVRKFTRNFNPPWYLKDYHYIQNTKSSTNLVINLIVDVLFYSKNSTPHFVFLCVITFTWEPTTFK